LRFSCAMTSPQRFVGYGIAARAGLRAVAG
jgi:hypothetical protein